MDWQGQKDLNPRHAVLEWMWEQRTESKRGPVSPGSRRKPQRGRCWFGAAEDFPLAFYGLRVSCLRNSLGEQPAYFWNVRVKWLWEENPK